MPQTAQVNRSGFQPTAPPSIVGENGKTFGTVNAENPNQREKKYGANQVTTSAPVQKLKSQESSPANNPRPQQVSEEPKHHTVVSPPEAPRQQQRPEPPPSVVQPPVHTSAPPAQISKAPAANPDQSPPSGKNPDKKKKDETQLQ
jgi:hypothetical protein